MVSLWLRCCFHIVVKWAVISTRVVFTMPRWAWAYWFGSVPIFALARCKCNHVQSKNITCDGACSLCDINKTDKFIIFTASTPHEIVIFTFMASLQYLSLGHVLVHTADFFTSEKSTKIPSALFLRIKWLNSLQQLTHGIVNGIEMINSFQHSNSMRIVILKLCAKSWPQIRAFG